ncbi:MAG: hypothetical protein RL417_2077 [Pseudomonadota bacterium]|jgi:voltage-gated sodium channel
MSPWCKRLAESEGFETFILSLIILNAALMGLETSGTVQSHYGEGLHYAFVVSQIIFVVEIGIRLGAYAPKFREFFHDFWNSFDFIVVAASLIPAVGGFAAIARVARVFRVMRIISVSDEMRAFIEGMGRSLGLLFKATVLLAVLGYIFAISGFYLFSEVAPASWGTLADSFRSVFFLALLQRVPEFFTEAVLGGLAGKIFFPVFYLVYGGVLINLIAAVTAQYRIEGDKR